MRHHQRQNASADSLTIDTGGNTIVNHGILEATSGATLVLNSDVDNRCGIIQATGSNATVELNDITVSNGTLESSCGGLIQIGCGSDTTIECASITCGTDVQVDSGATLTLDNDTVTGTTFHDACGAVLAVDGDTTLTLSGVTVHGGAIDGVDAATSGDVVASTIDVTGDSTFCGVHLSGGNLTVESDITLTLSGDKVSDVAIAGTDASGSIVASTIDVTGDSTFCDVSLSGGDLTIEDGVTLTLAAGDSVTDTTIEDGTITSGGVTAGTIDVTGDTAFSNVTLSDGKLTIEGGVALDARRRRQHHRHRDRGWHGDLRRRIAGTIDVTGETTFASVALSDGNLTVEGGVILMLSGDTISGTTIEDGTVTSGGVTAGTIDVTGDTTFSNINLNDGNLTVEGGVTLKLSGDTISGTAIEDGTVTSAASPPAPSTSPAIPHSPTPP